MDSSAMSLFGSEFSLFGGDLLFSPAAPINEGVVTVSRDGLCASPLSTDLAWPTDEVCLGRDVLGVKPVSSGDLLEGWLDTRIDLLSLVAQQDALTGSATLADLGLAVPNQDSTGLLALKLEAEKTALELSTPKAPERLTGDAHHELLCQGSENVYDQGLGLLELLTSNASDQKQEFGVGELAALDLDQDMDSSDAILSHMSPEDVESILSSGPLSPESLVTEESFESLMSSVIASDSFNETSVSVMNEVSLEDNTLPAEWAVLNELVIPAAELSDSIVSSDEENISIVTKSRPTPYSRSSGNRAAPKAKKRAESGDCGVTDQITDRKLRKKQQNKDAATRYRIKKKSEQESLNKEVDALEGRNTQLKDKVDRMTKEIQYLKTLIAEVYKARAETKKSKRKDVVIN